MNTRSVLLLVLVVGVAGAFALLSSPKDNVQPNQQPSQGATKPETVVASAAPGVPSASGTREPFAKAAECRTCHESEYTEWQRSRDLSTKPPQELLARAVELIDSQNDDSMVEAKTILERLIAKDPRFDAAYVELARVAMKTNWGTEGLHQAESLLSSALQIDPQSANAKILMGYVYVHQKRYAQAESLFADAARSNPPNLWLWANWGELLAAQGKLDQATLKYREAVTRPRPQGTYDRARLDALNHLVMLFEKRNDIDGTEAMMKQREEEYGPGRCFSTDYARFLLEKRGDVATSIKVSSGVVGTTCSREKEARQVLGMGYYMMWAGATGAQRNEALNQARVYLPAGPMPLYLLAASERTLPAAKQLIAAGEKIDQTDNEGLNALAYAIQHEDLAVAKRLLQLGAKPDTTVGYGEMPVALMAVMSGNVEAIRLMQQYGADYRKLRYQGATAFDVAKGSGDNKLLEVLNHKAPVL